MHWTKFIGRLAQGLVGAGMGFVLSVFCAAMLDPLFSQGGCIVVPSIQFVLIVLASTYGGWVLGVTSGKGMPKFAGDRAGRTLLALTGGLSLGGLVTRIAFEATTNWDAQLMGLSPHPYWLADQIRTVGIPLVTLGLWIGAAAGGLVGFWGNDRALRKRQVMIGVAALLILGGLSWWFCADMAREGHVLNQRSAMIRAARNHQQ